MLFNYQTIHIEISSKCVLKCPRCPRTELPLDTLNQDVSLAEFKIGFPTDTLDKIKHIMFCGDIGDPIYASDFLNIVAYIKNNSSIRIQIVTNGSYKKAEWWQELGSLLDYNDQVTFSVDGWDDESNNLYRVNSKFDTIVAGIQSLRASSKCRIQWSTIYFEFNQYNIDKIRSVAENLGCDSFKTVKSSKFDNHYLVDGVDYLKPQQEFIAKSLVYDVKEETLQDCKYQVIVPAIPEKLHSWAKCLRFEKDLFIGVDGLVLPCPWFNSGYIKNKFVEENSARLSMKSRSFFEVLNDTELWQQLLHSFDTEPFKICSMKCKHG